MFAVVASGAMTMTMWAVPVRCVRYAPRTSVPGTTKSPGPVCPGLLRKSSVSAQRVTGDRPGVGPVAIKAPKVSLHASTITHSSPDGTTAGEGDLSLAVFDREYRHKHRVLRRRSGDSHLDLGAFLGCGDDLDGAAQILDTSHHGLGDAQPAFPTGPCQTPLGDAGAVVAHGHDDRLVLVLDQDPRPGVLRTMPNDVVQSRVHRRGRLTRGVYIQQNGRRRG